jgi:hypothetical protein
MEERRAKTDDALERMDRTSKRIESHFRWIIRLMIVGWVIVVELLITGWAKIIREFLGIR